MPPKIDHKDIILQHALRALHRHPKGMMSGTLGTHLKNVCPETFSMISRRTSGSANVVGLCGILRSSKYIGETDCGSEKLYYLQAINKGMVSRDQRTEGKKGDVRICATQPVSCSKTSKTVAAEDLALHVAADGGSVAAVKLQSFYSKHPHHKDVVGNGIKKFCEAHPEYFFWSQGASPAQHRIVLASPSKVAALALSRFVKSNGNFLSPDKVPDFYDACPEHKKYICGKLRAVCNEHKDLLCYNPASNCVTVPLQMTTSGKKVKAKAKAEGKSDNAGNTVCASSSIIEHGRQNEHVRLDIESSSDNGAKAEQGSQSSRETQPSEVQIAAKATRTAHARAEDMDTAACPNSNSAMYGMPVELQRMDAEPFSDSESDAEQSLQSSKVTLPVDEIRWAHSSIKIRFKMGKLLVDTLQELVERKLEVHQLPMFQVAEVAGSWYAMTGNRRLWVFREYARICGHQICVSAKRLSDRAITSSWAKKVMTTTNYGTTVEYVYRNRSKEKFPSMMFALAKSRLAYGNAPDEVDMALGHAILQNGGSMAISQLSQQVSWPEKYVDKGKIGQYLSGRSHLFIRGLNSVSLTTYRDFHISRCQADEQPERPILSPSALQLASYVLSEVYATIAKESCESSPSHPGGTLSLPLPLDAPRTAMQARGISEEKIDPWHKAMDPWQRSLKIQVDAKEASCADSVPIVAKNASTPWVGNVIVQVPEDPIALMKLFVNGLVSQDIIAPKGSVLPLQKLILDVNARPRAFFCHGAPHCGTRLLYLNSDASVVCSQEDVEKMAANTKADSSGQLAVIPGTMHRVQLLRGASHQVLGISLRLGHNFHGACEVIIDVLADHQQNVLLSGFIDSGKTTLLRDAARWLSAQFDVMVMDKTGEMWNTPSVRYLQVADFESNMDMIKAILIEHAVEVLVMDDLNVSTAFAVAEICRTSGVRMLLSVRETFSNLAKSRVAREHVPPNSGSELMGHQMSLPWHVAVEAMGRDFTTWHIIQDAGSAAQSILQNAPLACQIRSRTLFNSAIASKQGAYSS